jgi:hypothetical protein
VSQNSRGTELGSLFIGVEYAPYNHAFNQDELVQYGLDPGRASYLYSEDLAVVLGGGTYFGLEFSLSLGRHIYHTEFWSANPFLSFEADEWYQTEGTQKTECLSSEVEISYRFFRRDRFAAGISISGTVIKPAVWHSEWTAQYFNSDLEIIERPNRQSSNLDWRARFWPGAGVNVQYRVYDQLWISLPVTYRKGKVRVSSLYYSGDDAPEKKELYAALALIFRI